MQKMLFDQLHKDVTGFPDQTVTVVPSLAAGVTLTSDAAGTWAGGYGAAAEILAAVSNITKRKIIGIQLNTPSAATQYQVQILAGTVAKAAVPITVETVAGGIPPIMLPRPIVIETGVAINGKVACNGGVQRTIVIKLITVPVVT
jgi:hypothetical protein